MHVQVKDRLPSTGADVEHSPVPIFNASLACDVRGSELTIADQFGILSGGFLQSENVFFGNDQNMGWSLRIDIVKRISVFVFVDLLGRYLPANDAAEQTVVHDTSIIWDWRHAALQRGGSPGRGKRVPTIPDQRKLCSAASGAPDSAREHRLVLVQGRLQALSRV